MAKHKANKANKVRNQAKAQARKEGLATLIDRLKTARAHRITMTTQQVADLYNAALAAEVALNPSEAPTSGVMVGFRFDEQPLILKPCNQTPVRYADFRYGHVTPVFTNS